MKYAFLIAFSLITTYIFAQHPCALGKLSSAQRSSTSPINSINSVLTNKYDVKFQHLDLNIELGSKDVSGMVRMIAEVSSFSLDTFSFELHSDLTIDSVKIASNHIAFEHNNHLALCKLPITYNQGELIDANIYYHGTTPSGGASAIDNGFNIGSSGSWGADVVWTLSEPFVAYEWFPCKQLLTDKLDSVWVYVTTDSSNKAGSNGKLTNITSLGSKKRYEWKSNYPINYYLISITVADYIEYNTWAHPEGVTDSVLVQNFIYDNPYIINYFKEDLDMVDSLIEHFSEKFGMYPFYKEKYGHCMAPFGGGMEHQTMTSLGFFDFELDAHELGHQWWGDNVTCSTWRDIWINEGFASYSEYVALERFYPNQTASKMQDVHSTVMQQNGGSIYVDDTTDVNRIFSSRLSYEKGSALVHLFRYMTNNDTLFFEMLKDFQMDFQFSNATGLDFMNYAKNYTGVDYSNMFNQWYFGQGYPTFTVKWNQVGNEFYISSTQTTSYNSVTPLFQLPVQYKLVRNIGDTIVKLNHNQNLELYSLVVSGNVTSVTVDPLNWIPNKVGSVTKDVNLILTGIEKSSQNLVIIAPNPTSDFIEISGINEPSGLTIKNTLGQTIYSKNTISDNEKIDVRGFAKGLYLVEIESKDGNMYCTKKIVVR